MGKTTQILPILFLLVFQFSMLRYSVLNIWKNFFWYEMAKINSEKQKNYALASKKSLLGLAPGPVGGKSPSN